MFIFMFVYEQFLGKWETLSCDGIICSKYIQNNKYGTKKLEWQLSQKEIIQIEYETCLYLSKNGDMRDFAPKLIDSNGNIYQFHFCLLFEDYCHLKHSIENKQQVYIFKQKMIDFD